MPAILAKKLGMTQRFSEDGKVERQHRIVRDSGCENVPALDGELIDQRVGGIQVGQ